MKVLSKSRQTKNEATFPMPDADALLRDVFGFDAFRPGQAEIVDAVARQLDFDADEDIPVSWSGGVFRSGDLVTAPFKERMASMDARYRFVDPIADPTLGAALYALRCAKNLPARQMPETANQA